MTKKVFTLLLLTALCQCSIAQTATLDGGMPSKECGIKKCDIGRTNYIGATDSSVYLIQEMLRRPKGLFLTRYDKNMAVQARRELTESDGSHYLGGYVSGQGVELMLVENDKRSLKALAQRFDLVTLEPVGAPREMKSADVGDNGKYDLKILDAPSGDLSAAIYLLQGAGQGVEAQVSLFDNELEELWLMDCPLHVLDDAYLSDSGEVVLSGYYTKKNDTRTFFEITYMDGDRIQSFDFDCDLQRVHSMEVVRLAGDRIYVTGAYLSEASTQHKEVFEGIYAMTVNMKNKAVERIAKHVLTKEERECMANRVSLPKNSDLPYEAYLGAAADDQGVTVAYHHAATVYSGPVPMERHMGGILLLRVNDKGDIAWTRALNRHTNASYDLGILMRASIRTVGDKTMVVYGDTKYNKGREQDAVSRVYLPVSSAGELHVVMVSHNGDMQHQYLPIPDKMALVGKPHRVTENEYKVIFAASSKMGMGELRIN